MNEIKTLCLGREGRIQSRHMGEMRGDVIVEGGAERQWMGGQSDSRKKYRASFMHKGTRYMYVVWRTSVSSPALSIQVFDHIELYAGPIMTSTPKKGLLQTKGKKLYFEKPCHEQKVLDSNFGENNNEYLIGLVTYQTHRQVSRRVRFLWVTK
mmetsp:Transcript_21717/g.34778  ORF Transcript_21717/g.34778 Transcript_21717/m.34778 type:complete len:153 (-) Transcript_21717:1493-1951(-)